MQTSESIASLAKALSKAQSEVENAAKVASNPHFRSKYADLAEIINTVRPVFAKHGISIIQSPSFSNGICSVETMLLHDSGEWIKDIASAPVVKHDPQGIGSATTYLRRYAMAGFANIAQEDDDGNAASKNPAQSSYSHKRESYMDKPEVRAAAFEVGKSIGEKVFKASVAEPADAADSKPAGETHEGSIPSAGTTVSSDSKAGTTTTTADTEPPAKLTPKEWSEIANGRKITSAAIGREITDEDLTEFGRVRYGKESKTLWTRNEFNMCKAWLTTMWKEKSWIDYKFGE